MQTSMSRPLDEAEALTSDAPIYEDSPFRPIPVTFPLAMPDFFSDLGQISQIWRKKELTSRCWSPQLLQSLEGMSFYEPDSYGTVVLSRHSTQVFSKTMATHFAMAGGRDGWQRTILHSVVIVVLRPPFPEVNCKASQESGSLDLSHESDAHLNPWQPSHCHLPPKSNFGTHKGLISDQLNSSFGDLYHKLVFSKGTSIKCN